MCTESAVRDIVRSGNPKKERFIQFFAAVFGSVMLSIILWSVGAFKDSIINEINMSSKGTHSEISLLRNDVINNEALRKIENNSRMKFIDARCVEIRGDIKQNRDRAIENRIKIHAMHNEAP